VEAHAGIDAALREMHAAFEGDGEEVQREWVRFTQRVDKRLEEALRATVKRSLQVGGGGCAGGRGWWSWGCRLWWQERAQGGACSSAMC